MRITLEQREAFRRAYNEAMSRKDMAKADEIAAVWGRLRKRSGSRSTITPAG